MSLILCGLRHGAEVGVECDTQEAAVSLAASWIDQLDGVPLRIEDEAGTVVLERAALDAEIERVWAADAEFYGKQAKKKEH